MSFTLQEMIEQKARGRAKREAARAVSALPVPRRVIIWVGGEKQEAAGHFVVQGIEEALREEMYEKILEEETAAAFDAITRTCFNIRGDDA
jgi:hypothetical protein